MSEIRERAKSALDALQAWNPSGGEHYQHDLIDSVHSIITDLLAELERVESVNQRLESRMAGWEIGQEEDLLLARQQSAIECMDLVTGMAVFPYRQTLLGVASAIKDHFKLQEAPK